MFESLYPLQPSPSVEDVVSPDGDSEHSLGRNKKRTPPV